MATLRIPYSDDLLASSGQSQDDLEQELRFWLAVKLFEIGRVSVGRAAEIAGMPRVRFMDELGKRKVPIANPTTDQVEEEFRDLRAILSPTPAR